MSFGKEFCFALPTAPGHWQYQEEKQEDRFLMMVEKKLYIKANGFAGMFGGVDIFIDLQEGKVLVGKNGVFVRPPGIPAFPTKWSITTTETEPRLIFSYP